MKRTLLIAAMLCAAGPAPAQTGVVRVEQENFRADPGGTVLASVLEGMSLQLGEQRGNWREAVLEGWVWSPSLQEESTSGLLLVTAAQGENLRSGPNGERIARLEPGMRLVELGREDRWVRVRRTGWIWQPSLAVEEAAPAPEATGGVADHPADREWVTIGADGMVLLDAPAGDSLAMIRAGGAVEIVDRNQGWARVRVEGWVWAPDLEERERSGVVLGDLAAAELRADPELYHGRTVEWSLQFIAVDTADRVRSDFYVGEPYILARGPGEETGFVYVAVPPDRLAEVQSLRPLERIEVLARIRVGRSAVLDAPVLELLDLR